MTDTTRSHEALARIRRLYDIEAEARSLEDDGRRAVCQGRSRPVLDELFGWLEGERDKVLPKSPMGVAVGYALGNRPALTRYTEAGFLQIDNNASERDLRAVAIGRKNYLFAGSDGGGRSAAVLYSVVGTCRRLGLDPFTYLLDAVARLPATPGDRVGDLLPGARGRSAVPDPGR